MKWFIEDIIIPKADEPSPCHVTSGSSGDVHDRSRIFLLLDFMVWHLPGRLA